MKECEVCGDEFTPDKRRKNRCAKEHHRSCVICEKDFIIESRMKSSKTFCSRQCSAVSNKKEVKETLCHICGNSFLPKTRGSKTCSKECTIKARRNSFIAKNVEKECELCGTVFVAQNSTQKYCENDHYKKCTVCGKEYMMRDVWDKSVTCGSSCASTFINTEEAKAKAKLTNLQKYGVENVQATVEQKDRVKQANIQKYGVEHPMMLKEFQDKVKANNVEKYGVEYILQVPEIRDRIEKTNLQKYGVRNPGGIPEVTEKVKKTFLEKYGKEWANQSEIVQSKRVATNVERYGVPDPMMIPDSEFVKKAQRTFSESVKNGDVKHRRVSLLNSSFADMLKDSCSNISTIEYESVFGSYSADLNINDKKLLIDIHPTVSHNVLKPFGCVINGCGDDCSKHKIMSKDYHYQRALVARDEGTSLLQVFDWDDESSIVKMVNAKTSVNIHKVSARKLMCEKISQFDANVFLQDNHIQGGTKGQSHCYGLFTKNDTENNNDENNNDVQEENGRILLAVATFGKNRFNKNYEYEFIRYAVKENYLIHGGSGKLFKEFTKDADPSSVLSYVDFNHTTGSTFLPTLGFEEVKPTGPALVYFNVKNKKKFSNSSLLMVGADRLLGTDYGSLSTSGLNNHDIMILEGFVPIYTAGNRVFAWKK